MTHSATTLMSFLYVRTCVSVVSEGGLKQHEILLPEWDENARFTERA